MGHGHITPNADGSLCRCGGPALCDVCAKEAGFENAKAWNDAYDGLAVVEAIDWLTTVQFQSNPPGTEKQARIDLALALAKFVDERIGMAIRRARRS